MLALVMWKELSLPRVVRLNHGSQRYPNSSPWNLNVTLYGKCDFADVMRFSWIIQQTLNEITSVFLSSHGRFESRGESNVKMKQRKNRRCYAVGLEDAGRSHEPKNAGTQA